MDPRTLVIWTTDLKIPPKMCVADVAMKVIVSVALRVSDVSWEPTCVIVVEIVDKVEVMMARVLVNWLATWTTALDKPMIVLVNWASTPVTAARTVLRITVNCETVWFKTIASPFNDALNDPVTSPKTLRVPLKEPPTFPAILVTPLIEPVAAPRMLPRPPTKGSALRALLHTKNNNN